VLRVGVQQHPGSAGIARQLVLMLSRQNRWQEAVGAAERCLDHLLSRQPVFQCSQCGFKSQDIYWKCPQCHHWDTMEPL
jgi:lipopolysaccharide assembly protein B